MSDTPSAAELIHRHQQEIINQWLETVVEQLPAAKNAGRAELADHLLNLLDDIVQTLQDLGPDAAPDHVDKLGFIAVSSSLHGRERASIREFTVGDLVHEYILLRHIVTGFCGDHLGDDTRSIDIVNRVIEAATLNAVNEFARTVQEIQQKLIATLVHDVRTPLGVAYNYVEILSMGEVSPQLREQAVKTVVRNLRRSVSMLEEMLDTVKLGAGGGLLLRFEDGDLAQAMRTVCAEADQIYQRRIEASVPDREVLGVFDMAMVVRTVENLISNAVKFGDMLSPIQLTLEDHGDTVVLCVHNKGRSIPENDQEGIFKFFSSPRQQRDGKGWGLGLSLIKSVAESHGGEVIFQSTADAGTTFGMRLRKRYRDNGEELTMLL